jgi:general secretion pathway protein H
MSKASLDPGFTLLEVVLVVFIIGLVLAVSYPSLTRGNETFQLRTTSRNILSTMRYAREKAVTEQKEMRVVADRENQKLILSDELGEGERTFQLPKEVRIERMVLGGQEVQQGPMAIRFLPNGSSESCEILLASRKGLTVLIFTDPITGGARVQEPAEESRQ